MTLAALLSQLVRFYEILIIAYILMSWFRPSSGMLLDIYRVLGTITEPWLGIFRRFIPPMGAIDFSPIVALLVLRLAANALIRVMTTL
ncbi:MAG: YGGT family protein [Actinobacteria bacterium 66_15]|nr:MAG: YGGT family protein [Actinobacteria bacterium 66_15]